MKPDSKILTAGLGVILSFAFLYHNALIDLVGHWNNEDFSYCYLVPLVAGYLAYLNKDRLRQVSFSYSSSGLFVLGAAGVLFLIGRMGALETIVYFSIWLTIAGIVMLMLGWQGLKAMNFPLFILLFIVPLPPFINQLLTFKLRLISSGLSVGLMRLVGLSAFREGNIIEIGATQLQVVDACSGLRFVYPLILMGLIVGYLFHKRWWERIVLVTIAIPISIGSNALRIAITGFLTKKVSPELAEGFFHGFSGWLVFMVSLGILLIVGRIIKDLGRKSGSSREPKAQSPKLKGRCTALSTVSHQPSAKYLWSGTGILLLFGLIQYGISYNMIKPARTSFAEFPSQISEWQGERTFLTQDIMESLWADDYVQIHFANRRNGQTLLLFVPYYEYQDTKHCAHAPISCLLGGGWAQISRTRLDRDFPEPLGKVEINQVVLEKSGQKMLANFWFQQRSRIIPSEYMNKWYLFQDAISRRRTDGALVRIEMPLAPGQDPAAAQAVVDEFTRKLEKILPRFVPN